MNEVLTLGTFDVLHHGHVDFLIVAAGLGHLTVGVNTDEFVSEFKPESPIMNLEERRYAIEQLGYDTVVNTSAGRELIEDQAPNILVVGSDWARKDYYSQIDVNQDWLDERGITLAYIPYVWKLPISTTEIKRRIRGA